MEKTIKNQESRKGQSSVDYIVSGIKTMMIEEKLKVGDKLPTEYELSETFGKSRSSVREAIKILASYGVLEVRRGDGTYVSSSIQGGVFDALFFQIVSMKMDISELIQLRELLETGILQIIIKEGKQECYQQARSAQDRLNAAIEQKASIQELVKLDLDFHKCIAGFAGNNIMEKIYDFMLDIFTPYIRYSYVIQNSEKDFSVSNHHDLLIQAIEEMDGNLAQYAVHKSMKDWLRLNRMYQNDRNISYGDGKNRS